MRRVNHKETVQSPRHRFRNFPGPPGEIVTEPDEPKAQPKAESTAETQSEFFKPDVDLVAQGILERLDGTDRYAQLSQFSIILHRQVVVSLRQIQAAYSRQRKKWLSGMCYRWNNRAQHAREQALRAWATDAAEQAVLKTVTIEEGKRILNAIRVRMTSWVPSFSSTCVCLRRGRVGN